MKLKLILHRRKGSKYDAGDNKNLCRFINRGVSRAKNQRPISPIVDRPSASSAAKGKKEQNEFRERNAGNDGQDVGRGREKRFLQSALSRVGVRSRDVHNSPSYDSIAKYPGREAWRGRGGEKILESKTEELNFQRRGAQRVCGAPLRRAARSAPVAHAAPVERDLHTRNACTRACPSVSVHAATRVHA